MLRAPNPKAQAASLRPEGTSTHSIPGSTWELRGGRGFRQRGNSPYIASNPRFLGWQESRMLYPITQALFETVASTLPSGKNTTSQIDVKLLNVDDGTYTVKGVLSTEANPSLVYGVLTDYESNDKVYDNIVESKLVESDGQKLLRQRLKWSFLIFSGTFRMVMTVLEDTKNKVLEFNMLKAGFMRKLIGRWHVLETNAGGSNTEYVLSVKPVVAPPAIFQAYTKKIFEAQVQQMLKDLDKAVNSRRE